MTQLPYPDYDENQMRQEHGTVVLITNPAADRLLEKAKKKEQAKYDQWCGGPQGWDDYTERWHME